MPLGAIVALALLAVSLAVNCAFLIARLKPSPLRARLARVCMVSFAVMFTGIALEFVFYGWVVQSDGWAFTLSAQRWTARYMTPTNSLGYRDKEHPASEFAGRKSVIVVGDSIVAGFGIRNPEDRFPDLLQKDLGPDWAVVNVSKGGWDSRDQLLALEAYPQDPQVVILAYVFNDFEGAAIRAGLAPRAVPSRPGGVLGFLVNRSYVLNYLYWRLYRSRSLRSTFAGDASSQTASYDNPDVWRIHSEELTRIISYANSRKAQLVVLIVPVLNDIQGAKPATDRVATFFRSQSIPVVDISDQLAGRGPQSLMVNSVDAHPNEQVHIEFSKALATILRGLGNP